MLLVADQYMTAPTDSLRILLLDEQAERFPVLEAALTCAGYQVVGKVTTADNIQVAVERTRPLGAEIDFDEGEVLIASGAGADEGVRLVGDGFPGGPGVRAPATRFGAELEELKPTVRFSFAEHDIQLADG